MAGQEQQSQHPASAGPAGPVAGPVGPEHRGHVHAHPRGAADSGGVHHSHEHVPHPTDDMPSVYVWRVYHPFEGLPERAAVEVSPRRGLLPRWRFVVPHDYKGVTAWGVGPPGGGPVNTGVKRPVNGGPTVLVNGPAVVWFGGHDALSSRLSAYLVFEGDPPHYLAFGEADEPGGPPRRLEGITFSPHDHPAHSHGGHHGGRQEAGR
jgi:hypothetical protein